MVRRIVVLFFLVVLCSNKLFAAQHEIKKGEIVSKIVLRLTGSANYLRDGIKVVTDKGVVISGAKSRAKFDHVHPTWMVVIDDKLAKTELVKASAGKTLAQVCAKSFDARCDRKLAKLNGIISSRMSKRLIASRLAKPLSEDVYAMPGLLPATVAAFVPVATVPKDVCPNIKGVQEAVPVGLVVDRGSNCIAPPPPLLSRISRFIRSFIPSSSSSPPSFFSSLSLLWLIPPLMIGFIAVMWNWRSKRQSLADTSAIQSRMEDIASKFEDAFKKRLPPRNTVKMDRQFDIPRSRCKVYITPIEGNYPNTTDHADNLEDDINEIRQELEGEPFTIKDPFPAPNGVGVELTYHGGSL